MTTTLTAYSISAGWHTMPSPLPPDFKNLEAELSRLDYCLESEFGACDGCGSLGLSTHCSTSTDPRFLVSICTSCTWQLVAVPDCVSLAKLYAELLPGVEVAVRLDQAAVVRDREREERRRHHAELAALSKPKVNKWAQMVKDGRTK